MRIRIVFVGVFFTLLLGCFIHGIRSSAPPSYSPSSVSSPAVINPSPLDGKANSPNSWHKGHVHAYTIYRGRFRLDDGTFIKLSSVFTWLEIGYAKEEIKRLLREKK